MIGWWNIVGNNHSNGIWDHSNAICAGYIECSADWMRPWGKLNAGNVRYRNPFSIVCYK